MFWKHKKSSDGEFTKTFYGAKSNKGFYIQLRHRHWIDHISGGKRRRVFAEFLAVGKGVVIYKSVAGREGFEGVSEARMEEIYSDVERALKFLGYEVEIGGY